MGTTVPWPFAATLTQVKAEGPATLKNRPNATMGHGGEVSPSYERMTVTPNDQFSSVIVIIVVFASLFWNILYLSMFSYLFLFCVFYGSSGYTGKDKRFNIEGQVEGI